MASTWTVAEPTLPALTFTYSFGPGIADSLAFPVEGGVAVVSPPCKAPAESFAELEKHGKVRALIAPNAYHHMGLPEWKARYPEAEIFAPAQSIARVEKQTKLGGIRPLAEATKLGDRVELIDMPHFKSGEVLVRWRIEGGWAWYVTDVFFNFPELPKGVVGTGSTHHFALVVDSADEQEAWRDYLRRQGVECTDVFDRGSFRSIYIRDPDGHIVEIATRGPGFSGTGGAAA